MAYEPRTGNASGIFFHGNLNTLDPVYSQDTQFFFSSGNKAISVPRVSGINQLVFLPGGGFGTPTVSGLVQVDNSVVTFASGVNVVGKLTGGFIDNTNIVGNAAIAITKLASSGTTFKPTGGGNQVVNIGDTLTFNQGSGIAVYGGTDGRSVTVSLSGMLATGGTIGSATTVPVISVNQNGIIYATGSAALGAGSYLVQTITTAMAIASGITLIDATSNPVQIKLPTSAAGVSGTLITIKRIDASTNNVTVGVLNAGDKLDGTANGTRLLTQKNESSTFTCDGQTNGNWWII